VQSEEQLAEELNYLNYYRQLEDCYEGSLAVCGLYLHLKKLFCGYPKGFWNQPALYLQLHKALMIVKKLANE